uniref:Si:ch211-160o17.2 n=1 Tax=Eptatretus burgeri TaxID=7764 RepID=A0A8C4QNM2_EPTBU
MSISGGCGITATLLHCLVQASEKAAAIARLCRSENALFELLVQEKTGGDKNKKFVSDFKTLADVLIQEVIKHDVGVKFPVLVGHIHGEENSKFTNGLGESETVRVCASVADTAVLLTRILDGNARAGQLLAHAVHVEPEIMVDHRIRGLRLDEPPNNLAIWVDPIDSTNQYIQGGYNMSEHTRPHSQGLPCVTVLIGVYERIGGLPVMGVVNQPFVHYDGENGRWSGNVFWGVCCNGEQASSLSPPDSTSPADTFSLVLSSSEDRAFRSTLEEAFGPDNIYLAAGAGYKELCVAKGLASVFVSSEDGGTYMWDSCGPHALLRALGGGIVRLKSCLEDYRHKGPSALASTPQIRYHKPLLSREGAQQWANEGGLVAYSSDKSLCAVIEALAQACGPDDTTTDKL